VNVVQAWKRLITPGLERYILRKYMGFTGRLDGLLVSEKSVFLCAFGLDGK
jgi:hypothetical protein